jgi:hypothetical protein
MRCADEDKGESEAGLREAEVRGMKRWRQQRLRVRGRLMTQPKYLLANFKIITA